MYMYVHVDIYTCIYLVCEVCVILLDTGHGSCDIRSLLILPADTIATHMCIHYTTHPVYGEGMDNRVNDSYYAWDGDKYIHFSAAAVNN